MTETTGRFVGQAIDEAFHALARSTLPKAQLYKLTGVERHQSWGDGGMGDGWLVKFAGPLAPGPRQQAEVVVTIAGCEVYEVEHVAARTRRTKVPALP